MGRLEVILGFGGAIARNTWNGCDGCLVDEDHDLQKGASPKLERRLVGRKRGAMGSVGCVSDGAPRR